MSKVYQVTYTHVIERKVTELVRANNEEEAIKKSQDGDYLDSDEDCCPEDGIEIKDYEAVEADNDTQEAWPSEEEE